GLAFGAFAVSALLLRPVAGRLCDTRGRRPLLVGGALLAAVAMLLTVLADGLAAVVALRLLIGVAEGAFMVASFAALADLAPPSRVGEALSYNSLGLYLGLALGPPLGEALVRGIGYDAAWYAATALCVLAALAALAIGETREARPPTARPAALVHSRSIPPALGFFASVVAMGGFLAFASLHAEGVGMTNASVPLFTYGMTVVTCRIVFARVMDRFPPLVLGAAALVTMAAGLGLVAAWPTPWGVVSGAALLGVGIAFSTPAFFAAVFATAAPAERGAASATATIFFDLGLGGGPILLGLVAQGAGIPAALVVGAAVALAGAAWTLALRQWSGLRQSTS
ncbi:MFS transporter, partial [Nocardioides sp.]|uniref:MFS transporter n=1 Tax=Nocardioides sp. TaxID=35761 RepID=UPI0027353183